MQRLSEFCYTSFPLIYGLVLCLLMKCNYMVLMASLVIHVNIDTCSLVGKTCCPIYVLLTLNALKVF